MDCIKSLNHDQLCAYIVELKQPSFRVKQLEKWLYEQHVSSFDEMSNLPNSMREVLASRYRISMPSIAAKQVSVDGTRKYLIEFDDGVCVETVGIPSTDGSRLTVCISSQAGCAMGCIFCATGHGGFTRNLTVGEIFDQVKLVEDDFSRRVSNVVVMGQGEPFANYDATLGAVKYLNSPVGMNIGARHITISSCGIIKGIEKFSQESEQFTLAISLHSAIQSTRDYLMPGVSNVALDELKESLKVYGDTTKRRPSLEYALIADVNDDERHLDALIDFCKGMLCHVNLIPLNPINSNLDNPNLMEPSSKIKHFESSLNRAGIEVSIRSSRGSDIDGACGQLKQRLNK